MQCVSHCPGLAIFRLRYPEANLFLPVEYEVEVGAEVWLVDDNGKKQGEGIIEKVLKKADKNKRGPCERAGMENDALLNITGIHQKRKNYPEEIDFKQEPECESETYVCHCEDVSLDELTFRHWGS